jgi:hypothetical protein
VPATESLGETAETGGKALIDSKGTIDDIATLAENAEPAAANLKALTESLEETGAFERILSLIFYAATSQNGFDELGYYARARVLTSQCATNYVTVKDDNCQRQIGGFLANDPEQDEDAESASASRASARTAAIKLPTELTSPGKTRAPKDTRKPAKAQGDPVASAEETVADYLLGGDR